LDKIDATFITFGIEVSSVKVVPVPFKIVVGFIASVKGEMCPAFDFKWFADFLGAVLWVNFDHFEGLEFIGCCLVVKHNVGHRYNTNFFELVDSIEILFFEAVFCADCSFLVEFSKVKEVIDSVTNIIFVGGLKSRWHPNVADAQVC